jgi:hypothetical protein
VSRREPAKDADPDFSNTAERYFDYVLKKTVKG